MSKPTLRITSYQAWISQLELGKETHLNWWPLIIELIGSNSSFSGLIKRRQQVWLVLRDNDSTCSQQEADTPPIEASFGSCKALQNLLFPTYHTTSVCVQSTCYLMTCYNSSRVGSASLGSKKSPVSHDLEIDPTGAAFAVQCAVVRSVYLSIIILLFCTMQPVAGCYSLDST